MRTEQVGGEDRGDVLLYALSTCGWCRKTKALLKELGVQYRYVDVDLVPAWGGRRCSGGRWLAGTRLEPSPPW